MSEQHPLPDRLRSGQVLRTRSGGRVRVRGTSQVDEFGEPVYRLTHLPREINSLTLWSRDRLDEAGCEEEDATQKE
jgi:hypothetical protein